MKGNETNSKIKHGLAAFAALAALALGGAAIVSATGTSVDDIGGDGDQSVPASVEQQARGAAEQATGGSTDGDVEPAEQPDPAEDQGDPPPPKGAAYEVEVSKDGQSLKVYLDSSFNELDTVSDEG